jgi:hypothetical protein
MKVITAAVSLALRRVPLAGMPPFAALPPAEIANVPCATGKCGGIDAGDGGDVQQFYGAAGSDVTADAISVEAETFRRIGDGYQGYLLADRRGAVQSVQHRVHADARAIRWKISQTQIDQESSPSECEHQGWILREVRTTTADALSAQCGRIIPSRELPQKFVSFFAVGLVLRCADSRLLSGYHRPAWAPPST